MIIQNHNINTNGGANTWFVRNEQGGCYGPVDLEIVKDWVKDGRVGPTNSISNDQIHWQVASSFAVLEMCWVAEVTPGNFYGPIHAAAIKDLRKEGAISDGASLFKRSNIDAELTGQTSQAKVDVMPEQEVTLLAVKVLEERVLKEQQRVEASETMLLSLRQQLSAQTDEAHRVKVVLEAQVAKSRQRTEEDMKALCSLQHNLATQTEDAKREKAGLDSQIENLRQMAEEGAKALCDLQQRLEKQTADAKYEKVVIEAQAEQSRQRADDGAKALCELQQRFAEQSDAMQRANQTHETQLYEAQIRLEQNEKIISDMRRQLAEDAKKACGIQARHEAQLGVLQNQLCQKGQEQLDALQQVETLRVEFAEQTGVWGSERQRLEETGRLLQIELKSRAQAEAMLAEALTEVARLRTSLSQKQAEQDTVRVEKIDVLEAEPLDTVAMKKSVRGIKREQTVVEAHVISSKEPSVMKRQRSSFFKSGRKVSDADGTALIELELQARRELERLGAQGKSIFFQKK